MLRRFVGGFIVTAALGCATGNTHKDPCQRAVERLEEECGFEVTISGSDPTCEGAAGCEAVCLERSPCDDIAQRDGEFAECVGECQ